jgi:hypothetical protein
VNSIGCRLFAVSDIDYLQYVIDVDIEREFFSVIAE